MTYVYRHYSASGELLYAGQSLCAVARLSQHRRSPWFDEIARVEIEKCCSQEYAQFVENMAIRLENPKYNKVVPSYDCRSISLTQEVIRQARNEIWVESWNPFADHSKHENGLIDCLNEEDDLINPWYRRKEDQAK